MNPLKLLVLAVFFYIGWRLVRKSLFPNINNHAEPTVRSDNMDKVKDILVEDPVCHTFVPKKDAIRLRYEGRTYYFCSEACCDSFSVTVEENK
ncbi:MAG: YHS domain-containing protein [Desulfobulbaceae bacterium]|nr:YHS domain-containing protein [Desulfobulbaceae bacterium]